MKRYRFVGTQEEANEYLTRKPILKKVYSEDDIVGDRYVRELIEIQSIKSEWQEVDMDDFKSKRIIEQKIEYSFDFGTGQEVSVVAVVENNSCRYVFTHLKNVIITGENFKKIRQAIETDLGLNLTIEKTEENHK